jgi:hypothetical protein
VTSLPRPRALANVRGVDEATSRAAPLELAYAALSTLMVAGLTLDIWAHHHVAALDSFFTPWHAVLYSAYGVTAAFLVAARRVLPPAYRLALAGAAVFAVGGVVDAGWHGLFGVERDLEAAVSPSHLVLAAGGLLMVSAPLSSALRRPAALAMRWLPPLTSLGLSMTLVTQLTEYANAFSRPWAAGAAAPLDAERVQMLGLAGVLVQSAIVSTVVLLPIAARWRMPFLSLTFVLTTNAVFGSFAHDVYLFIAVAFLAGIGADGLRHLLEPAAERPGLVRVYAAAAPGLLFAIYFLALATFSGVWWSVPLWSGSIILASATGLMLSFLSVPPRSVDLVPPR